MRANPLLSSNVSRHTMLFAETQRTDSSPKRATESDFAFLDRSAWAPIGEVRVMMEACLANYPGGEAKELPQPSFGPDPD